MPNRQLDSLFSYCQGLSHLAGKEIRGGEIFAKILTRNDDSGRHGVWFPSRHTTFSPSWRLQTPTRM